MIKRSQRFPAIEHLLEQKRQGDTLYVTNPSLVADAVLELFELLSSMAEVKMSFEEQKTIFTIQVPPQEKQ